MCLCVCVNVWHENIWDLNDEVSIHTGALNVEFYHGAAGSSALREPSIKMNQAFIYFNY